jgi:hypothetical protein
MAAERGRDGVLDRREVLMTMTAQPPVEKADLYSVQLAIDSAMDRAARLTWPGAEPGPRDGELIARMTRHLSSLIGPAEQHAQAMDPTDKAREIAVGAPGACSRSAG